MVLGLESQSDKYTKRQQATIEITCHENSIIACSRHTYMGVVLCTHAVHGDSHNKRDANRMVATMAYTQRYIWLMTILTM